MNRTAIAILDANFLWTQHLFHPLARHAQLLYLEPKDFVTARQSRWPLRTLFRLRELSPNHHGKRYALPPGWFSKYPAPFMKFLAHEIRRWFQLVRASRRVLAISYPQYVTVVKECGADVSFYYWSDDFRSYWFHRRERIAALEREAVECTDFTVCASATKAEELKQEVPACAEKISYLIHGHHPSLLPALPLSKPRPLPPDIAHLPRPVLGHWGQISRHLDFRLVHAIASHLPQASVLFIGPILEDFDDNGEKWFEACRRMPNVHFVGPRPYESIAECVPSFDVCLVLYRPELDFCRVINPSKIRDYLASTRPVVSTPLPEAKKLWADLIRIGGSISEYIAHVQDALSNGRLEKGEAQMAWAQDHTWERAAERLWQLMEPAP